MGVKSIGVFDSGVGGLTVARELIRQLEEVSLPRTCPHGRPTMIHLTRSQLEKEFGRTG